MRVSDIEQDMGGKEVAVPMRELLQHADSQRRANWTVLPDCPGVYAVCLSDWTTRSFTADTHLARYATPVDPCQLCDKRNRILAAGFTDILYIGKASNLRKRIRQLARFGVGRDKNHKGGEWLWQLEGIEKAQLRMWCCPRGEPERIERKLLEQFKAVHGDWPLANRM